MTILPADRLEYDFMGWQGDELLNTHPCFIVTESLKNDIILNGLTGVIFNNIAMTFSDNFYFNKYKEIIVSEKALGVLKQHKIDMCIIEKYI